MRFLRFAICFLILPGILPLFGQQRVDLRNTYERLVCVVPMIGAGTPDDPRRPMYVPKPGEAPSREGIIAFTYQLSDDGKSALVEFVAHDHAGLAGILRDREYRQDLVVFEKGRHKREDIEREFRKYKKDFNLDNFGAGVQ